MEVNRRELHHVAPAESISTSTNDTIHKESMPLRVRRRNRMITSCLECRRRKLKCDKVQPACTNCLKFSRECNFLAPALDSASQRKFNEIKEKMGTLERTLEEDVALRSTQKRPKRGSADLPGEGSESDEGPVPEDEKNLEVTPLAMVDGAYDDDTSEDVYDLGFKVGKFRMTDRLGGLYRPKLAEEMAFALVREDKDGTEPEPPLNDDQDSFLEPGPNFIAPGSGFMFGDAGDERTLIDYLPPKSISDLLVQRYYSHAHFVAKVVHWPSFRLQYESFWTSVQAGTEPPPSLQAIVFAVYFTAIITMTNEEVQSIFNMSQRSILVHFQTATETTLAKAHFLRTTRFETLQALIMYLVPMVRNEVSRAHSVLVGAALRLGECFGLHRDPVETFGCSPIEAHVRRLAWFNLCYLDYRTAETQGPRPTVKREEYDTKLPWNVNDADLVAVSGSSDGGTVLKDKENQWTDVTLTRMRFECNEMHRIVWFDRIRLDKKKVSITHCLSKIEAFRKAMEQKYAFLDIAIPIQHYARKMLDILTLRMHIMILHKFHNSIYTRFPDRLRQIILNSGTIANESAVMLDRDSEFQTWKWFSPSHQQWHILFLLLNEVFRFPNRREADRIWACADYVFEPNLSLSRVQKARSILGAVRDRAAAYRNLRKMKEPVSMRNQINSTIPARGAVRGPETTMLLGQRQNSNDHTSPQPPLISRSSADDKTLDWDALIQQQRDEQRQKSLPQQKLTPKSNSKDSSASDWVMDTGFTRFVGDGHTLCEIRKISTPINKVANVASSDGQSADQHSYMTETSPQDLATGTDMQFNANDANEQWPPSLSVMDSKWPSDMLNAGISPPNLVNSSSETSALSPPPLYSNGSTTSLNHQYMPSMYQYTNDSNQVLHNANPTNNLSTAAGPEMLTSLMTASSNTIMSSDMAAWSHLQGGASAGGNSEGAGVHPLLGKPVGSAPNPQDLPMLDIDWNEWDKMFPLEVNKGDLDIPVEFEQGFAR